MIIHEVEQGSPEWFALRAGKITGTKMKKAMSKDYLSLVDSIIADMEKGISDDDSDFMSDDMLRGTELEPLAREQYELITGNIVQIYGFVQSDIQPILCLSPDGFIGADGAIEIKSPRTKTHIKYMRQDKIPSEYEEQVNTYFMVNPNLQWLDFISYDPTLLRKPIWIKRTTREERLDQIEACWDRVNTIAKKIEEIREQIFF